MMEDHEQQYERIARYLDGEEITLRQDEQRLAEEISQAETSLAGVLDVALPTHTAQRVLRQMQAASLVRSRRWLRIKLAGAGLIAAAAVVLLAMSLLWRPILPPASPYEVAGGGEVPRPASNVSTTELMTSLETSSEFDLELDLLAAELDKEEFEIATTPVLPEAIEDPPEPWEKTSPMWDEDAWDLLDDGETSG